MSETSKTQLLEEEVNRLRRRVAELESRDITEREQAEAELRESVELLRAVQKVNPDLQFVLDSDQTITSYHAQNEADLYESPRNFIGKTMQEVLPMEAGEQFGGAIETAVARHALVTIEYTLPMPDGERVFEARVRSLPDQRVVITVRDITERNQAEVVVSRQIERLRRLSELSMALAGDPIDVFQRVAAMIGQLLDVRVVCLSEVRGDELHFISVYVDGEVMTNAGHCLLSITPCATVEHSKDIRVYDRVAERFPEASFLKDHDAFAYCGFPSLDSEPHTFSETDKDLLRVLGQRIAMEFERREHLREHRHTEEALKKTHEDLAATTNALPDLMFDVDQEGRIHDYRAPNLDGLYAPPETFLGRRVSEVLPAAAAQTIMQAIVETAETGLHRGATYCLEMPDGFAWFELSVAAKRHKTPDARFIVLARDITERKQAEHEREQLIAELEVKNTELERFTYTVSHDLKSPLVLCHG